jgi:hypothetical protein
MFRNDGAGLDCGRLAMTTGEKFVIARSASARRGNPECHDHDNDLQPKADAGLRSVSRQFLHSHSPLSEKICILQCVLPL